MKMVQPMSGPNDREDSNIFSTYRCCSLKYKSSWKKKKKKKNLSLEKNATESYDLLVIPEIEKLDISINIIKFHIFL